MRKKLVVWTLFVTVLLGGSSASLGGDFRVFPELRGDIVQRDGNNVTDEYIESVRDCQNSLDLCLEGADEAPAQESKSFIDGVTWGVLGGILIMVLVR